MRLFLQFNNEIVMRESGESLRNPWGILGSLPQLSPENASWNSTSHWVGLPVVRVVQCTSKNWPVTRPFERPEGASHVLPCATLKS